MYYVLLSEHTDLKSLEPRLKASDVSYKLLKSLNVKVLAALKAGKFQGALVDCAHPSLADESILESILSIAQEIPVVFFNSQGDFSARHLPRKAGVLNGSDPNKIFDELARVSVVTDNPLEVYNPRAAVNLLKKHGCLSLLALNALSFRLIEDRYGALAFLKSKQFLHSLVCSIAKKHCSDDYNLDIYTHSEEGLSFYLFLRPLKYGDELPRPGFLEDLSESVHNAVENALWTGLASRKKDRELPMGMSVIPEISVGYGSVISSACEDPRSTVEKLIEEVIFASQLQKQRVKTRRKEYIQSIIHSQGTLKPVYQGIFNLSSLKKHEVDKARSEKSIGPIKHLIYGFESLIRAQSDVISDMISVGTQQHYLDPKLLTPDVMFNVASSVGVTLELDIGAMKLTMAGCQGLPGYLMVNIRPRNFYNIKKFKTGLIPENVNVVFEVSESEAIENFDLMIEVRNELRKLNIGVATDDFGKDYGGFERICKIHPDIVKLDRALISDIHMDKPRLAFITGLVQWAKLSGTLTLAEGVECWEEAECLQRIGVELIQGYLLHKPQPAPVILEALNKHGEADKEAESQVVPSAEAS